MLYAISYCAVISNYVPCICTVGGRGNDKSEGFSREIGRLSQEETILYTLSLHCEFVATETV